MLLNRIRLIALRTSIPLIGSYRYFPVRAPDQSPPKRTLSTLVNALPPLADLSSDLLNMVTQSPLKSGRDQDHGNFKLLKSFNVGYAPVNVGKWRSEKTGLTVVVGSHASPITSGHFVIASEIFDDTGRPHTLEHLIFLGSKEYPYKGVLDQLANRAGSNGTNAWTANDHTAYTISTAGSEGFLKMLPIYVDHILHPTITDSGFVTEVHHINGAGDDAGVVYSEMQARENQAGDLMALELQRALYPESSAYRSETGGLMSALRVLTAQQIRDYHAKYYVPHNLCLLIDGAISLPDLFHVLNTQVDPLILSHLPPNPQIPPSNWQRPFVSTSTSSPLTISSSTTKTVSFMEQDETIGEISVTYLGPPPTSYLTSSALKILNTYLTHSSAAPLQKEFIEIPKPYCTGIGFYSEDRVNKNELTCSIQDVPVKHLDGLGGLIHGKLERIVKEEGIDMDRMGLVLRRDKRKLLNYTETSVSNVLADAVIGDFLYGDEKGAELGLAFNDMEDYDTLFKWKEQDWLDLLDKYYVSAKSITIIGKPSAALSEKIEKDEKERLAKRREELGEEKLKELEGDLQKAKKESDTPPPPEMIKDFPLTDPKALSWIPVETGVNNVKGQTVHADGGEVQKVLDQDGEALPFQAHFSHVQSNFVTITALFDTIKVPAHLRSYFALISSSLFSLGMKLADGTVLTHEEVANQLNDFTVSHSASFAYRGAFSEVFIVALKVSTTDYEKAITFIRDLITSVTFSPERLSVLVAKQLQELPYEKRNGNGIARAWANRLAFDVEKSTSESCGLLNLLEWLPGVAERLGSDEGRKEVVGGLEEARRYLLDPSIVRVAVGGNVKGLKEPKSALRRSFIKYKTQDPLAPLSTCRETLTPLGENPSKKCILIPMASIEGSYSVHYANGPSGWDHPDLPTLLLASSVLNASESYLWKSIRGSGLAYGANVEVDVESGIMGFSVYRSPDARAAYEAGGKLLAGLVDGSVELDQDIIDGARSSMTYDYARRSETVGAAASSAYLNEVLKGVGKNYDQEILKALPSITLDDIRKAIKNYFLPIFQPSTSIAAVSTSAGKADEIQAGLERLGFEVERKELPSFGEEEDTSGSGSEGSGSEVGDSEDGEKA